MSCFEYEVDVFFYHLVSIHPWSNIILATSRQTDVLPSCWRLMFAVLVGTCYLTSLNVPSRDHVCLPVAESRDKLAFLLYNVLDSQFFL